MTVVHRRGKVESVEAYDADHSISGRQKRSSTVSAREQGFNLSNATSIISVKNFLDVVKSTHLSVLSQDVLNHYGEQKNAAGHYNGKGKNHEN